MKRSIWHQRIFHPSLLEKEHAESLLLKATMFDDGQVCQNGCGHREGDERMGPSEGGLACCLKLMVSETPATDKAAAAI